MDGSGPGFMRVDRCKWSALKKGEDVNPAKQKSIWFKGVSEMNLVSSQAALLLDSAFSCSSSSSTPT